ncbi:MAG: hypothetical protein GXO79_09160 [Chlorobi bacterium]|nr:hypothetical protein [Chlorobiota bacterium]
MNKHIFLADKLKFKQVLPIYLFIIIPVILFFFSLISVNVLLQFLFVSISCLSIIYLWHYNSKIEITKQSITYHSIYKHIEIKWTDVKKTGTFHASGLTIIDFNNKKKSGFFNKHYIYITTEPELKLGFVKKNSRTFIRFAFDARAYNLIQEYLHKTNNQEN